MDFNSTIQSLSTDIARRAIEDAIGIVNRAFDGVAVVRKASPRAVAHKVKHDRGTRVPVRDFHPGSLRASIASEAQASPLAPNKEIAARLGLDDDLAFRDAMGIVRRKLRLPKRTTSTGRDPSSLAGRIRAVVAANNAATNAEIAAALGVEPSGRFATACYEARKALGVPSPRGPGRP